jgi:flagellar biosynthetic protein FliR
MGEHSSNVLTTHGGRMTGFSTSSYLSWSVAVVLLSLRIAPVLAMAPLISSANVSVGIRLLFVFGLSAALCADFVEPSTSQSHVQTNIRFLVDHPGALIQAACTELALGGILALAVQLAFSVFSIAGQILDTQVGFGLAQVFDPASNSSLPILSTAFNQLAILVFFLVNGHHAVLRAIAVSLERLPLGQAWSIDSALLPIMKQAGSLFTLAFALVAPVVFCVLMAELALGVIARNLPQMNMLAMGVPIKIMVGIIALSLWLNGVGSIMDRTYKEIYATWNVIFAAGDPDEHDTGNLT